MLSKAWQVALVMIALAGGKLRSFVGDRRLAADRGRLAAEGYAADRGQAEAMRVVSLIVALTVGAIVAAFLLPIGLEELAGSDLGDNASSGAVSLWNILDVIIVLAVFLFFIAVALKATDRL